MDHESEISSANRTRTSYRVSVSVIASRRRVLDDLPSWINNNSERSGDSKCNCDGGANRLTGTDNGQKTRSNGQGLTYSGVGKAEGSSGAPCGRFDYGASTVSASGSSTSARADSGRGDATSTGSAIV
jgi:hypothetical protein